MTTSENIENNSETTETSNKTQKMLVFFNKLSDIASSVINKVKFTQIQCSSINLIPIIAVISSHK